MSTSSPHALDRAVTTLARLLPLAATIRRGVLGLGFASLGSGAIVAIVLLRLSTPGSRAEWVAVAVVLALLLAPGAILLTFARAVGELIALPARVRELPTTGRGHAEELGRIARDARDAPGARVRSLPRLLWRFGSLTRSSRELLGIYAPVAALASLPYLALVAAASAAALLEVGLAFVVLLVLVAA